MMNDRDEPSPGGGSPDLDGVDLDLARRIDAVCRRFEADWRGGRRPRIDDYLAEIPAEGQPALRGELIALEQELCAAAAGGPDPETRPGLAPGAPGPPSSASDARRRDDAGPATIPGEAAGPPESEPTVDLSRSPHERTTAVPGPAGTAAPRVPEPCRIRYFGD
jgi:hypothetical protein